jgi:hypothetical protein
MLAVFDEPPDFDAFLDGVKFRIPPESCPVNPREKIQLPNCGVSKKLRAQREQNCITA